MNNMGFFMPTSDVIKLTGIKSILVTSLAEAKQHFDNGAYQYGYDNLSEALINTEHATIWGDLTPYYLDGSVEHNLSIEIDTLHDKAVALQMKCDRSVKSEKMLRELAALTHRIETYPGTPNKQGLLRQVEHLTNSWKRFSETELLSDEFCDFLLLAYGAKEQANEKLDSLEIELSRSERHETPEEQEGFLASIYNNIASSFNAVIARFNQYVCEPIQSAARSTASFFSARPVPTVSDEPDAEEAYSPPALQS